KQLQVPLEWEPPGKFRCQLNGLYDVKCDWEPITSIASRPEDQPACSATMIDRTKPLKWAWIELMPVPGLLFSQIWELVYFYMRIIHSGFNKGILVVRHEGSTIYLSVNKHEDSLIVIERLQ